MKKRLLPLFLALLLSLSACGSSSGGSDSSAAAGNVSADNGWAEAAMDAADTAGGADFSAVRRNAKLILNADLSLETQDFEKSAADIEKMTAEAGGYIESSGTYGDTGSRSANYTLRVENMHVVSRSRSSEDVTEQYTDIETRLATLQTKHERLLSLLEKADKMEDIIALENALADCEYEIDSLTGSKRRYDDLVGFSTFYINLREVQTLTATADGIGFGAQLTQAAKTGARGLADVVRGTILGVVMFWPAVILVIAGTAAGVILHRRRKAKRLAAWNAQMQQTPPAPPAETPQDNPQEEKE